MHRARLVPGIMPRPRTSTPIRNVCIVSQRWMLRVNVIGFGSSKPNHAMCSAPQQLLLPKDVRHLQSVLIGMHTMLYLRLRHHLDYGFE